MRTRGKHGPDANGDDHSPDNGPDFGPEYVDIGELIRLPGRNVHPERHTAPPRTHATNTYSGAGTRIAVATEA